MAEANRENEGFRFAPLSVPLQRRLQTGAVMLYVAGFVIIPIITGILFLACLINPFLAPFAIGYAMWTYYDVKIKQTSSRGGRRWHYFRTSRFWTYFSDFFPISIVKTADLDPKENYMLGYHPHGIFGCGAFCNFGSEATGFSEKFPGITPTLLTLKPNFSWPILRGVILWMGACDVSKESINWILTKQGVGNAAVIVIGGAEEALEARPGTYNITLKRRKGFVKMAIRTGAQLVPVFSFGENDLFHQADNPKGSYLRAFQDQFKKILGFSPPLFHGRGIFNYSFGLLPFRKPVYTVVGKPIKIEKSPEPSQEMIDKIHQQYMDDLSALFDEYKEGYGIDKDMKLNFV